MRVLCLLLFFAAVCCAPQKPDSRGDFANDLQDRAVLITKTCTDPSNGAGGSGIVLGPYHKGTLIATANHVAELPAGCFLRVGEDQAKVVAFDAEHDVALIWIDRFERRMWLKESRPYLGQDVWASGFPTSRLMGEQTLNVVRGVVMAEVSKYYQVSIPIWLGFSGGGVIDREGNLVGLVVAVISAHPNAAPAEMFVTPARYVFALVERL